MGYNISHDGSLVAMAFALGPRNRVWNIGVDVRRIHCPENVLLNDYIESLKHKVGPFYSYCELLSTGRVFRS